MLILLWFSGEILLYRYSTINLQKKLHKNGKNWHSSPRRSCILKASTAIYVLHCPAHETRVLLEKQQWWGSPSLSSIVVTLCSFPWSPCPSLTFYQIDTILMVPLNGKLTLLSFEQDGIKFSPKRLGVYVTFETWFSILCFIVLTCFGVWLWVHKYSSHTAIIWKQDTFLIQTNAKYQNRIFRCRRLAGISLQTGLSFAGPHNVL